MADAEVTEEQAGAVIRSRPFVAVLAIAAVVGVAVSLAAWCFLELTHQLQVGIFQDIPDDLGESTAPLWYLLLVLGIAGLITAFAIARLPGKGGHIPAHGLQAGNPPSPADLPGIILAAIASIGLGLVLGPEAPLIALGTGLGVMTVRAAKRDAPDQLLLIVGAAGSFAAVSFIFASPIIAAILLVEATGIGGPKLKLILLPGLLAAGIGSLVSIGMGSVTGLSTSAYALGALQLPHFARPDAADFGWTIALAIVIAIVVQVILRVGRETERFATPRPFVIIPAIGLIVAGLAYGFAEASGKSANAVLFSGQDALPNLVTEGAGWSLSALALLVGFKGLAYGLSLGSFRGGPTFPALFLGAAAGVMASRLPGFSLTPAVAVGMAAATVAVLQLPLSAVVLAFVLTGEAGAGSGPLIIVAVVVAYVVTVVIRGREGAAPAPAAAEERAAGGAPAPAATGPPAG